MARLRIYPHRVASNTSVQWTDRWLEVGGVSVEDSDGRVSNWDYRTPLKVGFVLRVDAELFIAETGLTRESEVQAVVLVDCPHSGRRFLSSHTFVGLDQMDGNRRLGVNLPLGEVAQSIRISGHLVAGARTVSTGKFQSPVHGARLHSSDTSRVELDGFMGRFPTEAAQLEELGFGNIPWILIMNFSELNENFLSSVRLLINPNHPGGIAALDVVEGRRFLPLLRAEILRSLISKIANEHGGDGFDFESDMESVANTVNSMTQLVLGQSLATTCRVFIEDPNRFEQLLAQGLDPVRSLVVEP